MLTIVVYIELYYYDQASRSVKSLASATSKPVNRQFRRTMASDSHGPVDTWPTTPEKKK